MLDKSITGTFVVFALERFKKPLLGNLAARKHRVFKIAVCLLLIISIIIQSSQMSRNIGIY
jgi:hypothetical protein